MRSLIIISILVSCFKANQSGIVIKDRQSLVRYAEPILLKTYGKEQILGEKPYVISVENGIWTMDGTLPEGYLGGTFHIVINAKDGKVFKLIHYK